MTNINETWQAALAERGDGAFDLFNVYCNTVLQEILCNRHVEIALNSKGCFTYKVELKPIAELVRMDIERYGKNAFWMYKGGQFCMSPQLKDAVSNAEIEKWLRAGSRVLIERKLAANIPFNLEWAKAGVAVEGCFFGTWELLKRPIEIVSGFNPLEIVGVDSAQFETKNLRHPYPPLKELGL